MTVERIAPGIYISSFYPGINVGFIVMDDGVITVDAPPLPADARAWRERVLEMTGGPIRYAILTDPHPDRLIGIGWMEAPVIAGHQTFRRLKEGGESLWQSILEEWEQRRSAAEGMELLLPPLPEVIVMGRLTLHGSPSIMVEPVAGAAPGSIWVRISREKVLFTGDTVVVGTHPPMAAAPDTRAWLRTLVDLRRARSPVDLIVPGRGPVARKEDTRGLSEYIQLVRRRVRSIHAAGGRRADLAKQVPEFLSLFPVEEDRQEWTQWEVLAGLERVFEELSPREEEE